MNIPVEGLRVRLNTAALGPQTGTVVGYTTVAGYADIGMVEAVVLVDETSGHPPKLRPVSLDRLDVIGYRRKADMS